MINSPIFNICKICNRKIDISGYNSVEDKNMLHDHLNYNHKINVQCSNIVESETIYENYFNQCDCKYCIIGDKTN